jgi:holin-like protein
VSFKKSELFNALYSIFALISCVVVGRLLAYFIPMLPGSLYGLILFTLTLHFQIFDADKIKNTVIWSIKHMGVCFVPAGVGIINHLDLIKQHGIAIVAITFATTFILLTVVGLLYQRYETTKKSALTP